MMKFLQSIKTILIGLSLLFLSAVPLFSNL